MGVTPLVQVQYLPLSALVWKRTGEGEKPSFQRCRITRLLAQTRESSQPSRIAAAAVRAARAKTLTVTHNAIFRVVLYSDANMVGPSSRVA